MKKLKELFRQPEFHALVLGLCLILFTYPLLIMSNGGSAARVYFTLFISWGAIILLLFFITRSYISVQSQAENDNEDGDINHV